MLLCVNCVFSAPGSPFSSPLRVHIFRSVQPCKAYGIMSSAMGCC
ncbi:unnamed protein product [Coffea canephora]|uniref:Uncharacterized protein n=1 Tax=Coffea canephora TaxID=49390 RepID=A0A068VDK1_COFCA|nr:unnamed protein product [Coffea canephora]